MNSLELFAGAGGLAIGMGNAGFHHAAVVEWDKDACETFRENQQRHAAAVDGWPVHQMDARSFDYSSVAVDISVISGGPPCQPFSLGGKHAAHDDKRDMFPEAVRAVRELTPKAFIFENVKGLTRKSFAAYFSYIRLQLTYPELEKTSRENWMQHLARLERHNSTANSRATYDVAYSVLNAANFGVPQKRERVFFVGFRSDLGVKWAFPTKTHSEDALLSAKWITGTYWQEHGLPRARMNSIPPRLRNRVAALQDCDINTQRWRTTRDAIAGLPDPETQKRVSISNHVFTPGARTYIGHTGSPLDEPAKTLKAGYHGVPGGENMLVKDDGSVRYFTVREAARLQTFPDEYIFHGSWSQTMRQLGNAVPVLLGQTVAESVATHLLEA